MPNFRLLAAMMIVLAEGLPAALFVSASAGSIATSGNSADYGNAGKMTAHAAAGGLNTISDNPGACLVTCFDSFLTAAFGGAQASNDGVLRAFASTPISGGAGAYAQIEDVFSFTGTVVATIHINGHTAVGGGIANADAEFRIVLPGEGETADIDLFILTIHRDEDGAWWDVFTDEMGSLGPFPGSPGTAEFQVPLLPALLRFSLSAGAYCDSDPCGANASFHNSVYIGLTGDYVSANGYSYPGFDALNDVPESSTAWPMAAGIAALSMMAARVRRNKRDTSFGKQ